MNIESALTDEGVFDLFVNNTYDHEYLEPIVTLERRDPRNADKYTPENIADTLQKLELRNSQELEAKRHGS